MTKIEGGPPNPAAGVQPGDQADLQTTKGVEQFKEAAGKTVPSKVVDSFQRAGPNLATKLQNMPGLSAKINFTNADLALLAQTFAAVLRQNPGADRKLRARLFAKAILKKKAGAGKYNGLLDDENDDEENTPERRRSLQELYDLIAEQLDATPVFAQLVDEVTEGARKIR